MLAYYTWNGATLVERLGIKKIGEDLRNEYNVTDAPMPERLAELLGELKQDEKSSVLTVAESCLRLFDVLDDVIRRLAVRLATSNTGRTETAPYRA
jgi:hypothetical protein